MSELEARFAAPEDPRAGNARRHSWHDIPDIARCAIICGGQTCTDMESSAGPNGSCCNLSER